MLRLLQVPCEEGKQSKRDNTKVPLTTAALQCRATPGHDKLASRVASPRPSERVLPNLMWLLLHGPLCDGQLVRPLFPVCEAQLQTAQLPCSSLLGTAGEHAAHRHLPCVTQSGYTSLSGTLLHDM